MGFVALWSHLHVRCICWARSVKHVPGWRPVMIGIIWRWLHRATIPIAAVRRRHLEGLTAVANVGKLEVNIAESFTTFLPPCFYCFKYGKLSTWMQPGASFSVGEASWCPWARPCGCTGCLQSVRMRLPLSCKRAVSLRRWKSWNLQLFRAFENS